MPCCAHLDGHQYGGQKPTETCVTEFCYKSVNLFLEELINIKVILFPIHEQFRYSETPPNDCPVYKITSLLRPYSFRPNVKTTESFYYSVDPVSATTLLLRPGFYGPTVVALTGFHCSTKFPEINHFFNVHDSSLSRHVNTVSCKSLEIQTYCKPCWSKNLYWN